MGNDKLLDQIFNLRFTSKTLVRQSKKSAKEETAEKLKVKKAIEAGNMDGARIYAQNAIRKKNEQLNYLRLASRLDAVVSRLDTQAKMNVINKSMANIVKQLEKALTSNNIEQAQFCLVAQTMDSFERQFENLDVQSEFVESAMSSSTSMAAPEDDINALMQQASGHVADQHGLEVSIGLPTASGALQQPQKQTEDADSDLSRRLMELKSRG
eukprot:jgi/Chlat1/543/Chrsp103S08600